MTLHDDGPPTTRPPGAPAPTRGLRAVGSEEPPFDPDYDRPPDQRIPPHDDTAEASVLGSLLLDPSLADQLRTELDATDFYRPAHEDIWTAAHQVLADNIPLDPVTLAAYLDHHPDRTGRTELDRIGGATYLHDLTAGVPLPANAPYYAKIVRDHARLRAAVATGTKLTQLGYTGDLEKVDHYLGEAVQILDDAAMRYGPRPGAGSGLHDLTWILTGEPPVQPPPAWAHRTDGNALFYSGKVNGIFGDPESGKTWLAQYAVVEALNSGGTAAMIDVDHNGPDHTAARLMLLGAHPTAIADPARFRYYEPEENDELLTAVDEITTWHPSIYLLDSLGEVLPMMGVKSVDNDEVTAALRRTCTPPAAAGTCVITVDHLPKSTDARASGYAIGATAKKRIMRGSYIRVEVRTQPAPGQVGRATLRIEKDTVGELRKVTGGGYAGSLILDSREPHTTRASIDLEAAPVTADGKFRPTHLMEAVSRFIEDNDQATQRDIREAINSAPKNVTAAIQALVDEGFIHVLVGKNRAKLHHSISHYREAEDDHPTLDI